MKDSKTIISHLKKHPSLKTLEQKECFDILIKLLPSRFTKLVRFLYTKYNTLFFVFNHPIGKLEFNNILDDIKDLLKTIEKFHPKCKCINQEHIKAIITNKKEVKPEIQKEATIFYKERSKGDFENKTKDEKLHEIFEKIRKEILKNNA